MDVDVVILIFGSEADELLDTPTMALSSSSSSSMFLFAIHSPLVFLNGNFYHIDLFRAAVNCSGRFFLLHFFFFYLRFVNVLQCKNPFSESQALCRCAADPSCKCFYYLIY
jgi:hypothetical protein